MVCDGDSICVVLLSLQSCQILFLSVCLHIQIFVYVLIITAGRKWFTNRVASLHSSNTFEQKAALKLPLNNWNFFFFWFSKGKGKSKLLKSLTKVETICIFFCFFDIFANIVPVAIIVMTCFFSSQMHTHTHTHGPKMCF